MIKIWDFNTKTLVNTINNAHSGLNTNKIYNVKPIYFGIIIGSI